MFSEMMDNVKNTYTGESGGSNLLNNVSDWCNKLISDIGGNLQAMFEGNVIGINANKIPDMIDAIEAYIKRIDSHLNEIRTNTSTENAMKGEYALAVKEYVNAACDVCYKITSHLRFFEDKLVAVQKSFAARDESMKDTIGSVASEMSTWEEYKKQN